MRTTWADCIRYRYIVADGNGDPLLPAAGAAAKACISGKAGIFAGSVCAVRSGKPHTVGNHGDVKHRAAVINTTRNKCDKLIRTTGGIGCRGVNGDSVIAGITGEAVQRIIGIEHAPEKPCVACFAAAHSFPALCFGVVNCAQSNIGCIVCGGAPHGQRFCRAFRIYDAFQRDKFINTIVDNPAGIPVRGIILQAAPPPADAFTITG